jgi:hypothetical protein
MFAHMIPAPFIDKFTAFLVWLAERIAEIRERNASRAQAELEQAAREQAALERAALERTGREQAGREQAECEQVVDAQDPALAAQLAIDTAPADAGPAEPDVRDGAHGRLPAAQLRPSPAILVPAAHADAAMAAVGRAGAQSPHASPPDIAAVHGLERHWWASQAVASARVRGADGVGWEANSGPGQCGRLTS